jgi:polysaccharide export outer membrane protein
MKYRKKNMKKLLFPIVVLTIALLLNSCGSSKKVAYFQNIDEISLAASRGLYDAKIMPKDLLTITVHTTDPAAASPFNLIVRRSMGNDNSISTTGGSLQGYLVDNDGDIDFPIIGKLHVVGLTKRQCENLIREKIIPYLSKTENPVITVRMSSYKVTVLGEVGHPGSFSVGQEKINILEALAQAGDLSIYGKRDNVLLIREDNTGQKHQYRLNLNDANLINSPLYYLQQNDVVYVEPNTVKAKNSDIGSSTTIWFSFISIATSVASLLVNILR